jgi:hypothetical protein
MEFLLIDENTCVEEFRKKLYWNDLYYQTANGPYVDMDTTILKNRLKEYAQPIARIAETPNFRDMYSHD